MNTQIEEVINEIKQVVIGKEEVIKKVMMVILAKGHVLLEDIPGVGKTTLALAFSKVMGLDFNRIQFTPDVMASDIVGYTMFNKNTEEFVFKEGAAMTNLLLADEINRTSSRTHAALLETMEEKNVTVDGTTYRLPTPFHVIATQNPVGSHGTQILPLSQLDRFMIKTSIGYPDFDSQIELLKDRQTAQPLDNVTQRMTREGLLEIQKEVESIHISEDILKYITHLTEATRTHRLIAQGVSPRGALALSKLSKASAFIEGRDFVIPEDIIYIFLDVCNHRVILDQKLKVMQGDSYTILKEIIETVKTPDNKSLV